MMAGIKEIKTHTALLKFIIASNKLQRKAILKTLDDSQLRSICAIIFNFLDGTFKVPTEQMKLLVRYKKSIRQIAEKKVKRGQKLRQLQQISEVLPHILKAALKSIS